mmetsp:Transcript_21914/g.25213  ORF Transcript_21914/g.25213 Transcript_21914/m.25213 type:complete len:150 (-) Transcript_21914:403-852(-)
MSTIIGGLLNDENNFPSLSASTEAVTRRDQLPLQENKNVDTVEGNKKSTATMESTSSPKVVVTATQTESSTILAPFVASVLRDQVMTDLLTEVHQLRTENSSLKSSLQDFRDKAGSSVDIGGLMTWVMMRMMNDADDDDDEDNDEDNDE